ncbi:MAG TPA: hypothetical protein VN310_15220 [Candidatus Dormibacteraeota bacterium]|jgi:hypothetical protein|nr:hypothetical protein [Candidatus Dormibacteraeota bacterium]
MKRLLRLFPPVALAIVLVSCSGRSSIPPGPLPNVSGSWEFIAASANNPGYSTNIEAALKEGQVFVNGTYQEDGQISASGQQINFVGFSPAGAIAFGGNCTAATVNPGNGLSGSISGVGGSMTFTYTENGNVFNVTAILDASNQSIDSGTYTEQAAPAGQSNGSCNGNVDPTVIDSGSIVGKIVSKLSGMYTGQICQPLDTLCSNTPDTATATLSQSGSNLTVNLLLTGTDNASFTLTGLVTGNAFSVQGTFQGQVVAYYGYYELTYDSLTNANDIPTLYLVNATNSSAEPTYAGTLTVPQTL